MISFLCLLFCLFVFFLNKNKVNFLLPERKTLKFLVSDISDFQKYQGLWEIQQEKTKQNKNKKQKIT